MKKLIMTMIAALAVGSGWSAEAIGPGSLYVGAEGSYSVVHGYNNQFGLFGIEGGYSFDVSSLFWLNPEASLYYQHLPELCNYEFFAPGATSGSASTCANTFGGGLGLYIGKDFIKPLGIFTGPLVRCNFYQKERVHFDNGDTMTYDYSEHRANLLWRFGLEFKTWRLRVRASYDLYVTDRSIYDEKKSGAVAVGIAFRL